MDRSKLTEESFAEFYQKHTGKPCGPHLAKVSIELIIDTLDYDWPWTITLTPVMRAYLLANGFMD